MAVGTLNSPAGFADIGHHAQMTYRAHPTMTLMRRRGLENVCLPGRFGAVQASWLSRHGDASGHAWGN
jgi:hypothetical protein